MIECASCLYELQCDWEEAVPGPCGHYRPDPDYKEPDKPLDRKSLYLEILRKLADTEGLDVSGMIQVKDEKDHTVQVFLLKGGTKMHTNR